MLTAANTRMPALPSVLTESLECIADQLTRPEGWIGVDNLGERASAGLGNPPATPTVLWTAPAGGENLQRAHPFRIRYTVTGGRRPSRHT